MVSQPNAAGIAGATNPGQPIAPSTMRRTSSGFGASIRSCPDQLGSGFGSSGFGGANGCGQRFRTTNSSGNSSSQGQDLIRHVRFLRRIPVDPMTGQAEWGMRSVQDDPDSTSWGGKNVFDVFSLSTGTALDGTKYSDW